MFDFEDAVHNLAIGLIKNALNELKKNTHDEGFLRQESELVWFKERSINSGGYGWALKYSGINPNNIRAQIIGIVGNIRGSIDYEPIIKLNDEHNYIIRYQGIGKFKLEHRDEIIIEKTTLDHIIKCEKRLIENHNKLGVKIC